MINNNKLKVFRKNSYKEKYSNNLKKLTKFLKPKNYT